MSYNESLSANSNYPVMSQSEWDSAPFNQLDIPEKDFDVMVSQTLSRNTTISTNNYIPGASGVDYDRDDEGRCYTTSWKDPDDTSDTDWKQAYKNCAFTPLELINSCGLLAKTLLEEGKTKVGNVYLREVLKDCEGWVEDDLEVMEN